MDTMSAAPAKNTDCNNWIAAICEIVAPMVRSIAYSEIFSRALLYKVFMMLMIAMIMMIAINE